MNQPEQSKNPELITKNIRKNLFGVRPKARSYSGVYHSRNYQNMTIDETFLVREKSMKRPSFGLDSKNWKTISLRDKVIGVDRISAEKIKYGNSKSFIKFCAQEQTKQAKIREVAKQGKIQLGKQNSEQYFQKLVETLIDSNHFFQKLEKTLVESVVLLSTIKIYEKDSKVYMSKNINKIGFILYGTGKYMSRDYMYKIEKGDTIGEYEIVSTRKKIVEDQNECKYPETTNLIIKVLNNLCILWISYNHYNILRQESIKQGFRQQFNKFDTQLRMNFLKKKNQKGRVGLTTRKTNPNI